MNEFILMCLLGLSLVYWLILRKHMLELEEYARTAIPREQMDEVVDCAILATEKLNNVLLEATAELRKELETKSEAFEAIALAWNDLDDTIRFDKDTTNLGRAIRDFPH